MSGWNGIGWCPQYPQNYCCACGTVYIAFVHEGLGWVCSRCVPPTVYPCLHPGCLATASFFAVGNEATLGHVCRSCWHDMPPSVQSRYQEGRIS